jgi:hypothetical protein
MKHVISMIIGVGILVAAKHQITWADMAMIIGAVLIAVGLSNVTRSIPREDVIRPFNLSR